VTAYPSRFAALCRPYCVHSEDDRISRAWAAHRAYLVDMAFRMLSDVGAAEDVVQEAFFRLLQTPTGSVDDERGWLIVVTGRLCLDHIKSARWRRERPEDMAVRGYRDRGSDSIDPADRVTLDDEVRLALLVVLERLTPAERVAFVLHDIFQLPFDVIGETVGRPAAACRQLASRARRKIEEARDRGHSIVEPAGHRAVTARFIAACANGDLAELLGLLDPNVSGEVDVLKDVVVLGADRVARNILRYWGGPGFVLVSHPASNDLVLLAFVKRELVGVLDLAIDGDRIAKIHIHVQPSTLEPLRARLFGAG
jgi:RNA polymerase sigma-70 factor, ECF subfamily